VEDHHAQNATESAFPDAQREHVTTELWMNDKPLGHKR
jgi:hypothetical protein